VKASPVMFIQNVGQFADGARFQVRGGDRTIWLAEDALWVTVVETPPQPSPTSGREFRPAPLSVAERGEGPGVRVALTAPQPPPLPRCGRGGGMSGAGAILRWHLSPIPNLQPRSPLSRSAGAGPGVRVALTSPHPPSSPTLWARRGDDAPHLPPAPLLSHAVGEEGGMSGAGAILRWHLSPMPNLQPRSPLSRSAGEGSGVRVALTSPLPPPLPRCGRGGGDERSRGDSALASVTDAVSTT
jgi:hypothetical protein